MPKPRLTSRKEPWKNMVANNYSKGYVASSSQVKKNRHSVHVHSTQEVGNWGLFPRAFRSIIKM